MSRVALVTGSGRDRIGRAVALTLAEAGYDIAVHYHSSSKPAAETVAAVNETGQRGEAFQANVDDEPSVKAMFQDIERQFGRLDALVTTSSIWAPTPLETVTAEEVMQSFRTNALGSFLCAREAGAIMQKQAEGGSIVLLGDWAIERPYSDHIAYFIAKGSIPTMTRALAVELGTRNPNIRVNCVHPGPVLFPTDLNENQRAFLNESTLTRSANTPSALCEAVLMLLGNRMATGVCLPIDGGRTIYSPGSDRYHS